MGLLEVSGEGIAILIRVSSFSVIYVMWTGYM
jgi:hypothetical protein